MWIQRKHYNELIEKNQKLQQNVEKLLSELKETTAQLNKTTYKLLEVINK